MRQFLDLIERLFKQILGRHAPIVNADGEICGHLLEGLGHRVQAGNPIVVILDGGEVELRYQLRKGGVNAAHLIQREFPGLELRGLGIVGKLTQQQIAADLFLVGEASRIDGRKLHEEVLLTGQPCILGLHRVVRDAVVVAHIAEL